MRPAAGKRSIRTSKRRIRQIEVKPLSSRMSIVQMSSSDIGVIIFNFTVNNTSIVVMIFLNDGGGSDAVSAGKLEACINHLLSRQ